MQIDSFMALWIWSLPLLLKFSGRETMLSFCLANLFALRQEVTANLIQISIEEDTIDQQIKLPLPNIHIIVASIQTIVSLKDRNEKILQYLYTVAG